MVIDFSAITRGADGKITPPTMCLKSLDGNIIGVIGNYFELKADLKLVETSTISFSVPIKDNGISTPIYDEIVVNRIIDIYPYGIYVLSDITTSGDGIREVKECSCKSLEYSVFSRQNIVLAGGEYGGGTYRLYSPTDIQSETPTTIMGIIHSMIPDWTISVDESLYNVYRTFDETDENLYDWMLRTAQSSYGCIFVFDCYNKIVNVYDANKDYPTLPVYLSYDNLLKSTEIKEDIDNQFTVLSVYGADPVNIYEVNPTGTNKIYNLDYFIGNGDIDNTLAAKWTAWQLEIVNQQSYYTCLQLARMGAQMRLSTEEAKLVDLKGEMADAANQMDVQLQAYNSNNIAKTEYDAAVELYNAKSASVDAQQEVVNSVMTEIAGYTSSISTVVASLKMEQWFTNTELSRLQQYFIEDTFTDSTFAVFDVDVSGEGSLLKTGEAMTLSVTPSTTDDIVLIDMSAFTDDEKSAIAKDIVRLNGGMVSVSDTGYSVTGSIVSGTIERATNSTNKLVCSIYLGAGKFQTSNNTLDFTSANLVVVGTCNTSLTTSGVQTGLNITDYSLYFTKNSTDWETYAVQKSLYDYAVACHKDIAYPEYEFTINSGNFIFAEKFEPFKNELSLGAGVYLSLNDNDTITPLLLEVHLSFEDETDFSLVFSNTYKRHNKVTSLKELLKESYSSSRKLDLAKYEYGAYATSGAQNEVQKLLSYGLDAASKQVTAGLNQNVTIDGSGITVKHNGVDGSTSYTDYIRINNGMISVMDGLNGNNTAKIGIGRFYDSELEQSLYGIMAPNIVGTMLAGENLIIQSVKDANGNMYFTVDRNGVNISNGNFALRSDSGERRIFMSPNLGITAGTLDGTSSALDIDEDDDKEKVVTGDGYLISSLDDLNDGDAPKTNLWIDLDGNVFMKGTVYATDGEFSGALKVGGDTGFRVDTTGNLSIGGTASDPNFYVSNTGVVNAKTGTFKGTLNASRLMINGKDILTNLSDELATINSKISPNYVELKGITIKNSSGKTTFSVDSNGKVTISGGSISIDSLPESVESASETLDSITTTKNNVTYIDGSKISTGSIQANALAAGAIRLGGQLTVYQNTQYNLTGGYLGYCTGASGENGSTGVGLMNSSTTGQVICTSSGARISYNTNSQAYTTSDSATLQFNKARIRCGNFMGSGRNELGACLVQFYGSGSSYRTVGLWNAGSGAGTTKFSPVNADTGMIDLGGGGQLWNNIYTTSSTSKTSDKNKKKNIQYGYDTSIENMFFDLKPCSYELIDGTSGRKHFGFISQDIEESMIENDISSTNFAGFVKSIDENGNPLYFLRYEEFISLNTYMIQKLYEKVDTLERQLNSIK